MHGVERQPTEDGLGQSWVYVRPESLVRDGEWHWPNEAEQLANARLIAAAPDLLDALKALVSEVDKFGALDWRDDLTILENSRAAISKATGAA